MLNIKWLWEQCWHLKIGWKRTRVTGARCPDSEYFSGGLGIHSLGARFSRVGAPDMNSFSASVSLASSSLTWNKGKLFLVRFNQSILCTCWNKGKRYNFIPKCSLMVACFKDSSTNTDCIFFHCWFDWFWENDQFLNSWLSFVLHGRSWFI